MSDIKIFHDNDADLSLLNGLTVGVIGYGSQGRAQALNMRDSGVKVIVGVRQGPSFEKAKEDGFTVLSVKEAAEQADIIHILLPDEKQADIYNCLYLNMNSYHQSQRAETEPCTPRSESFPPQ